MRYKKILEYVKNYLDERHNLGYAMLKEGQQLCRFARYADNIEHKGPVTTELAIQWAKQSQNCRPLSCARRLDIVRRFARYMKVLIPETQIPQEGLFGSSHRRPSPYIYSEEEIAAIMKTASNLTPINSLRPHTYMTLFGLLASSGMRISEALQLSRKDLNFDAGTITIVKTKYHKSRIIPLHSTTIDALKLYIDKCDKRRSILKTNALFINEQGNPLRYRRVFLTFRQIVFTLGWRKKSGDRGPRIHDIRHYFVVRRILQWYRNGDDVNQKICQLSTYLGHVNITNTYWYLTAVPELMAIAASRFENFIYEKEKK